MSQFRDFLGKSGKLVQRAAVAGGSAIADGFRAIDPDLRRHVFQVPLLGYTLLSPKRVPVKALSPDGHPPLVFVHGLGGDRGNFLLMAGYFRLLGRSRSYRIHFEPGSAIPDMADALARFVEEVTEVTAEPQVEIVAHSLGGLVTRLALSRPGMAEKVRSVVTLGTPHKGSYPARYANTEITRQLRPDSDLIREINTLAWPSTVRGVCFYSRNDVFVLPWESARLEGLPAVDVTPFTHYSYLIDPKSFRQVWKVLHENSPAPASEE